MRWIYFILAASLGVSGGSCYTNDTLGANIIDGSQVLSEMTSPSHHIHADDSHSDLLRRQTVLVCGPTNNNQVCDGGNCCSQFGFCGTGDYYCGEAFSCQPQYGRCGNAPPPAPSTSSTVIPPAPTTSSVIPPSSTATPTPTPSSSSTVVIVPTSSTVTPPLPSSTLVITTNGMCGNSTTCIGSSFGSCCSKFWYCGNSLDYCGTGCNPLFGACVGGAVPSSSSIIPRPSSTSTPPVVSTSTFIPPPPPSSTSTFVPPPPPSSTSTFVPPPSATPTINPNPGGLPVSTDGSCGNGVTCAGSTFGTCCSEYGFCGSSSDYCRALFGCQTQFGTCTSP
ncbi:hypothetical protein EG329_001883 [Mollisiaceae sp. DMI_Dod_QoI]|nr:hypothetical protein EG329_001883 [Helotiales sp. DMI_Dod_QoI]